MDLKDKKLFNKHCSRYGKYLPPVLPAVDRIIVIGDIHGDINVLITCLTISNLIKPLSSISEGYINVLKNIKWIGGKTVVVQVGDQIDSCRPKHTKCDDPNTTKNDEPNDILILKLFTELHKQAVKSGGAVYSLLGNHEIMNVMGQFNYVSYENLVSFSDYKDTKINFEKMYPKLSLVARGKLARQHAFKEGNKYASFLGCTRYPAIIIGDFMFVHAGITPNFMKKTGITKREDLVSLNYHVRKWLLGLINKDTITDIVDSHEYSLFWTRVLGNIPSETNPNFCTDQLEYVLNAFRIGHIVVGHTPQFYINKDGINTTCNEKIIRVDFGGSNMAFNGFGADNDENREPQVLEILNNTELNIIK